MIKREEGATAIEFAMVALPFILTLFGIIEISLAYTAGTLLEGGTVSAARLIRTGQIQTGSADPETAFREELCNQADILVVCDNIQVEAIPMPDDSFGSVGDYAVQYDNDGNMVSRGFDAGGVSDVMLVRVYYAYPFLTPMIGTLLGGADQTMPLLSTVVFQTEPYQIEE